MNENRIPYLDALKGFTIFFIVFNHLVLIGEGSVLGNILMAFSYGAVPCFMMVTGGLLHRTQELDWRKYFNRIFQIYLLLSIWKGLYLLFHHFLSGVCAPRLQIINYLFFFGNIDGVNSGMLWYLNAYLAVMLFYPITLILFHSKNKNSRTALLFLAILAYGGMQLFEKCKSFFGTTNIDEVAPHLFYGNMLFYFILGAFLLACRQQISDFLRARSWRKSLPYLFILIGIAGIVLLKYRKTGHFAWGGSHIAAPYVQLPTVLIALGIYLMIMEWKPTRFLHFLGSFFGQATMGIYLMHGMVIMLLQLFITKSGIDLNTLPLLLMDVLLTVAITVVCAVVTNILRKIPFLKELIK